MANGENKINYGLYKKRLLKKLREGDYGFNEVDEFYVDRFIESQQMADKAFQDVKERGIVCAIDRDGKVLAKNHSIGSYNEALKNIMEISKKLGLSARDRADLGWTPKAADDF